MALFNTNTIIKPSTNPDNPAILAKINRILDTGINSRKNKTAYRASKYLGKGLMGDLYLTKDTNNLDYILKTTPIINTQSIHYELRVIQFLQNNPITQSFITPCIEYYLYGKHAFTLFPLIRTIYSLNHTHQQLNHLSRTKYYSNVFQIIRQLLRGISAIHEFNIVHGGLNGTTILISIDDDSSNNVSIKFTDFGNGCSETKSNNIAIIDGNTVQRKCKTPLQSKYLDCWHTGLICMKLLAPDHCTTINLLDLPTAWTPEISSLYTDPINTKYIVNYSSQINNNGTMENKWGNTSLNTHEPLDIDIANYLYFIMNNLIQPPDKIKSAKYVLDKLITFDKYKN